MIRSIFLLLLLLTQANALSDNEQSSATSLNISEMVDMDERIENNRENFKELTKDKTLNYLIIVLIIMFLYTYFLCVDKEKKHNTVYNKKLKFFLLFSYLIVSIGFVILFAFLSTTTLNNNPFIITIIVLPLIYLVHKILSKFTYFNELTFIHPKTLEEKNVPIGFSFTTLFFGPFPAFFRKDRKWAIIILVLALITAGISSLFFAFIYNKIYIKRLLENGYGILAIGHFSLEGAEEFLNLKLPMYKFVKESKSSLPIEEEEIFNTKKNSEKRAVKEFQDCRNCNASKIEIENGIYICAYCGTAIKEVTVG